MRGRNWLGETDAGARSWPSFWNEAPNDAKNEGVGMLGMRFAGIDIVGKAFDSLFRAFSLTEDDRVCLDGKIPDADGVRGGVGSETVNCLGPASQGEGKSEGISTGDGG